ncbi:MAG: hypothetical protein AB7F64_07475, partial [Gammaproteobacteria bacterium]
MEPFISNNYDPIEDFSSPQSQQTSQISSSSHLEDYDPLEEFLGLDTQDDTLKSSFQDLSKDLKSIESNSDPLFFPKDVMEYDLYNVKPSPSLIENHTHIDIISEPQAPEISIFDSDLSNIKLEKAIEKFEDLDLHIFTPKTIENLKKLEAAKQEAVANQKELVFDEDFELDIQKVNVKRNPEQVAWAVQNNAFVSLAQLVDSPSEMKVKVLSRFTIKRNREETEKSKETGSSEEAEKSTAPMKLKMDSRWANLAQRNIKKINVYDEEGKLQRELHHGDFHVVEFTAAEIEFVSRLAFVAIQASFILRQ